LQVILSTHELLILDVYSGNLISNTTIRIVTMGGATPTRSLSVAGEAMFSPNEEVILFLSTDYEALTQNPKVDQKEIYRHTPYYLPNVGTSAGIFSVFGGFQGKYTVYASQGESLIARQGGHADHTRPVSLNSFVRSL
jgi:hypothetical protein